MPPPRQRPPRSAKHAALGEAIRRLRVEAGLSQEELAGRMDTDFTQIGGIERGTGNPSYATLLRLAATLDTPPGAIVSLADAVFDEVSGDAQPAGSD